MERWRPTVPVSDGGGGVLIDGGSEKVSLASYSNLAAREKCLFDSPSPPQSSAPAPRHAPRQRQPRKKKNYIYKKKGQKKKKSLLI